MYPWWGGGGGLLPYRRDKGACHWRIQCKAQNETIVGVALQASIIDL